MMDKRRHRHSYFVQWREGRHPQPVLVCMCGRTYGGHVYGGELKNDPFD